MRLTRHDAGAHSDLQKVFPRANLWLRFPRLYLCVPEGSTGGLPDGQERDESQCGREDYVEGGCGLVPGHGDQVCRKRCCGPREDSNRNIVADGETADAHASRQELEDRKSTRLNSSHANISYAV